jgi:hypothetical protein
MSRRQKVEGNSLEPEIQNSKFKIQNSKFKIQNSKFKIQNSKLSNHQRLPS